jgi:DNA modification methylase
MIHNGDCIEVMASFEPESIDAIVTDPPYGLEFMGKEWDRLASDWADDGVGQAGRIDGQGGMSTWGKRPRYHARGMQDWHEAWAREAFRVAKPGAHLLAFGGTRTYHRLAAAIEDAGWEIRDTLVWAYASGFPKSYNVGQAIEKRLTIGSDRRPDRDLGGRTRNRFSGDAEGGLISDTGGQVELTTDLAREWQGWGTALKPAWEPIVLARKPLRGTVAGNVTEYGTGALNIDGTRIPSEGHLQWEQPRDMGYHGGSDAGAVAATTNDRGRWPSNLLLTDPIFDGDTPGVVGGGETSSGALDRSRITAPNLTYGAAPAERTGTYEPDSGTYSRFFLVPKSSRSDREPVLDEYAYRLHRERGECDKLGAWQSPDRSRNDPTATTSPARDTSEARSEADIDSDTSSSGSLNTVLFPTDTRSITSTATSRTTDSETSSSSTPRPISASTPDASYETANGGSPAESAASSSPSANPTGISPLRAGRSTDAVVPAISGPSSSRSGCVRCGKPLPRVATHPTQKPTELMRHLIRLVTPPNGVVLDPFLGSGTTALAAEMEGFEWVGIEREAEYCAIAEARLNGTQRGLGLAV